MKKKGDKLCQGGINVLHWITISHGFIACVDLFGILDNISKFDCSKEINNVKLTLLEHKCDFNGRGVSGKMVCVVGREEAGQYPQKKSFLQNLKFEEKPATYKKKKQLVR